MHAIMFAVAADTVNMELNGHVAQIIANKGILYERENSYDQMILAGTKADRVEHGQRSRDMFRRNIGGMFFPEENRGTGKICFTQGQGEKDPESGQYPDIDTGELEQILKDMPFDEIVFKEFSEECLNAMLEKLSIHAPEEIREQIVAHKRALETIKELKGKIIWIQKDGKDAIPEKTKELEDTIRGLEKVSRLTFKQKKELEKAKNELQVIQIFMGNYPTNSRRPLLTDLKEFINRKLPGQSATYPLSRDNCRWQIFQYVQQTKDYDFTDLNRDLKRSGKERHSQKKSSSTGKKRGRPPMSPKTPRHAQKRR